MISYETEEVAAGGEHKENQGGEDQGTGTQGKYDVTSSCYPVICPAGQIIFDVFLKPYLNHLIPQFYVLSHSDAWKWR